MPSASPGPHGLHVRTLWSGSPPRTRDARGNCCATRGAAQIILPAPRLMDLRPCGGSTCQSFATRTESKGSQRPPGVLKVATSEADANMCDTPLAIVLHQRMSEAPNKRWLHPLCRAAFFTKCCCTGRASFFFFSPPPSFYVFWWGVGGAAVPASLSHKSLKCNVDESAPAIFAQRFTSVPNAHFARRLYDSWRSSLTTKRAARRHFQEDMEINRAFEALTSLHDGG